MPSLPVPEERRKAGPRVGWQVVECELWTKRGVSRIFYLQS